jgi:tRNA U34 5-methylaminomethyl-2-thiouridine-forming methyltransferase MnmC
VLQLCKTLDGSDTLFHTELQEHYHSIHGSIQESRHIFIRYGYEAVPRETDPVTIFEMGLGTGLNAWLTALTAAQEKRRVYYTAIELYPLPEETWKSLNFPACLNNPEGEALFHAIHQAPWKNSQGISPWFSIEKQHLDLLSYIPLPGMADLIYFDAFSPDTQPDLWTTAVFQKMNVLLRSSGMLLTYSCKGTVKRHLADAGFRTEKLSGPPGKREILRAWKS